MNARDIISHEIELLSNQTKKLESGSRYIASLTEATVEFYRENPAANTLAFERLRALTIRHRIQETKHTHRLNSLHLILRIHETQTPLYFERIIIGAGIAGTLVFEEVAHHCTNSPLFLPSIIVLNNDSDPNTWLKEGKRLMGQPAQVQTPQSFSVHSDDLLIKENDPTNPYHYVEATDFHNALIQTQVDLKMPIINLTALRIESHNAVTEDKDYPWLQTAKHRIAVQLNDEISFLYTDVIDLCVGLGSPALLSKEQLDSQLAEQLKKTGQLIYAQDGGDVELKENILMYGGSAINSAWATEILSGHTATKAKISHLVSRNPASLDDISTLSRFISNACMGKLSLSVGTLDSVREQPDSNKLQVTFKSSPTSSGCPYPTLKEGENLFCDQLIVAIGQQNAGITKNLTDFDACFYKTAHKNTLPIPLGTHSSDGSIIVWGAAGTLGIGLERESARRFNKQVEAHADTYPYESQALGGLFRISWVIPQMAAQLRKKNLFPSAPPDTRKYLILDINQATTDDLIPLIAQSNPTLNDEECKKHAEAIISYRAQVMDNANFGAPGIQTPKQLKKACKGISSQSLSERFFPFSNVRSQPSKKMEAASPRTVSSAPSPALLTYRPLSWLADRSTTDSGITLSTTSAQNNDDTLSTPSYVPPKIGVKL